MGSSGFLNCGELKSLHINISIPCALVPCPDPLPRPSSENQCWKQLLHHVQSNCDSLQMWLSSILKSWCFEMSICLVWECTFFSCSSVERLFDPFSASLFSHHAWFYVNINIVCTENTWRWQFPGSVSFHLAVCLKLNVHISFDLHTCLLHFSNLPFFCARVMNVAVLYLYTYQYYCIKFTAVKEAAIRT